MLGLSIILPVKHPEPYLVSLITHINALLAGVISYEVLVQYEWGLTNAVIAGVGRSQYPYILVMDADGQHDPCDILPVYKIIENTEYDVAVGWKVLDKNPFHRRSVSLLFRKIAQNLGFHAKDPMSGFVCGKRSLFRDIRPNKSIKFVLQLLEKNPRVFDYPIVFHKRKGGKSKINAFDAFAVLKDMFILCVNKFVSSVVDAAK